MGFVDEKKWKRETSPMTVRREGDGASRARPEEEMDTVGAFARAVGWDGSSSGQRGRRGRRTVTAWGGSS